MKLGQAHVQSILLASIPFVLAATHCGPLVTDPLPDAGASGSGVSGVSGTSSGTAAPVDDGAVSGASGNTSGSASSGSSAGSSSGGAFDGTAPVTDTGSTSGSSTGSTSGSGDASSAGGNLVTNGSFAQGGADWSVSSGPGIIAAGNSELCVSATTAGTSVLGWPQPPATSLSLSSGASYVFSYSARTTQGTATIEAKVANSTVAASYMPIDSDSMDGVTTSLTSFTHPFTPTTADPSAGIAFIFASTTGQSVCIQNVSLIRQ